MSEVFSGRYVRVEGVEHAGKTTQIDLAKQYATDNALDVLFVREPGATDFGKQLRHLLQEDESVDLTPKVEQMLYTADRLYSIDNLILPALTDGRNVIGDRGPESGKGYQAGGGGLSLDFIDNFNELVLPKWYKDATVAVIMVSRETQRKRMAHKALNLKLDKIEQRPEEYFDRVHKAYEDLLALPNVVAIDGEAEPREVFTQLRPVLFGQEHA